MKPLNRQTASVETNYPVKVLQFGEGNFLRGFVDWIIDTLNEKAGFNGSVKIIQPIERGIVHLLNQQEGLYHVLLNGIQGGKETQETRLITCVSGALNPYDDYTAFLQLAENKDLEFIISNTTEAGIAFEEADQNMETLPSSFPGKLTSLLYHRFTHFKGAADKGLAIIPCELIEKNGEALRQAVLQYVKHWGLPQAFSTWIEESNSFCNTLVDRIVPGFPKENIQEIQQELGYEDNLVVKAEPFHLWVIEAPEAVKAAFPTEKANLQVKFVQNLTPYRSRKVRILNGAHTAMVPVAYLQGLRTVREAVEDPQTGAFIREAVFEEIIPTLDLPEEELHQFAKDVIERFQNPFIRHELISIALNSISKYKVRVLPSVLEYKKRKEQLPEQLLKALAALILFYRGEWQGERIPLNDSAEILSFFEQAWQKEVPAETVKTVLSNTDFWDQDLTQVEGLADKVTAQVALLLQSEQENLKLA
ncbi:tagaturonate reductase [Pontibacter ummariensis]|uniref:Tagaturonate reductase n=1 Tax=Pontibacter ummariensis TaxID=1610492 RepID=A0A239H251_9BACT|nr:tagaturonate reductase [Pontibacter ummariensis]PRY10925.1 tagaturonate reductase [Pontibacter ummariensis]SNS75262.1 tagaturonate reductase [Pontibacter ummariensis]